MSYKCRKQSPSECPESTTIRACERHNVTTAQRADRSVGPSRRIDAKAGREKGLSTLVASLLPSPSVSVPPLHPTPFPSPRAPSPRD